MRVEFPAAEYCEDQSFREATFCFEGSVDEGWSLLRDGAAWLELGPGYRLLQTEECGVCSTDLARHFLPFPLPQVTGHEIVARDENGARNVVEINASHRARGIDSDCPVCSAGLPTHCPERLVIGIHDLPGGFGPWVLAPIGAVIAVPDAIPTSTAVLVEPFAAALNAVTTIDLSGARCVAVLGPRRLGMLVVAALRAHRERAGLSFEILALSRHTELLDLAHSFGATSGQLVNRDGSNLDDRLADVVIDTTGNPDALELAVRLAGREVHLKSTHGHPCCAINHLTELVVDELALDRLPDELPTSHRRIERLGLSRARPRGAWLATMEPPDWLAERARPVRSRSAADAGRILEETSSHGELPRADFAVVGSAEEVDAAIRPRAADQIALVRPRADILVHPQAEVSGNAVLAAISQRGLRVSSSRCGDFHKALALMEADPRLVDLGEKLVTHRFPSGKIRQAFEVAGSPACIKAVIEHPDVGEWP